MQEVHILFAHTLKVIFPMNAHGRYLYPVAVLPVGTRCGYLPKIDFRVEVRGEGIAVVTAIAVQNIDGVDLVEIVLLRVGCKNRGHTRIKAGAEQCRETGLRKLLPVRPLPGIIEVGRKTLFRTALFIDGTPCRILGIFRLIICGINVVHTGSQAGVHDGKILIG